MLPGVEPRKKRRPGAKTLLLGGGVAAAVVALFFKRDAVKGLLPGGDTETAPARHAGRLHAAARVQLRRRRSGCEHRDRRARPARVRGAGDRRGRRGSRRRGRGRQHRRHRLRLRRSRTARSPTRPSARWPRPARASPRARSRPRTSCARPPSPTEGMSPEEHQIDDAIDAGRQPAPRPVEPVKPADDSRVEHLVRAVRSTRRPGVRLGFAVKVLGEGGLPSHDARRWQSGPHLRHSLEHLTAILELPRPPRDPDVPDDVGPGARTRRTPTCRSSTRQVEECADELARGRRARARARHPALVAIPGQYIVLNSENEHGRRGRRCATSRSRPRCWTRWAAARRRSSSCTSAAGRATRSGASRPASSGSRTRRGHGW